MSKDKRNFKIAIWVLCAAFVLVLLTVKIISAFKEIQKDLGQDLTPTYAIPSEDSNLISHRYLGNLKVNKIVRSKDKGSVSLIYFKNDYHLIIYKIDLTNSALLKELLHVDIESVDRTTGAVYTVINYNNLLQFQLNDKPSKPVSQIYLTLAGDSLQAIVKNDSMVCYHFLCDNFSIRYAKSDPITIFGLGNEKMLGTRFVVPMDLMLLKRNDAVFLLIMTPNSPKFSIPPDLLYDVVVGQ